MIHLGREVQTYSDAYLVGQHEENAEVLEHGALSDHLEVEDTT